MFLEKIQLNGFKSFANPVELYFTKGITAIVGPNGSGKSNIADAIRWVLGEQSMKMIRGKKSEDVIFAGSDKKSRLGMAEVSLFLNNSDGQTQIDFAEISITRRFYRSGEGEYLLNGSKVRLSDIQLLLAQAGVGQRSYAVIGQGQIDNVIIASPLERKIFFDEATGVRQFQIKKEQALNKLEHTLDNLHQGITLLREIEPRLRSLTRQVRRLERKEEIEKELRSWQEYYYHRQLEKITGRREQLQKEKNELESRKSEITDLIISLRKQIDDLRSRDKEGDELEKWQDKYDFLQEQRQKLLRQLAMWQGRSDIQTAEKLGYDYVWAKHRLEELMSARQKAMDKLIKLENVLHTQMRELAEVEKQLAEVEQNWQVVLTQVKDKNSYQEQFDLGEVVQSLKNISQKVGSLIKQNLSVEELQRFLQEFKQELAGIIKRLEKSGDEKNDDRMQELQVIASNREKLNNLQAEIKTKIEVAKSEIKWQREKVDKLATELGELEIIVKKKDVDQQRDRNSNSEELGLKEKLDKLEKEIQDVYDQIKNFHSQEKGKREQLIGIQDKLQKQQLQLREVEDQLHQLEIELTRLETKQEDLALTVHQELGVLLPDLIEKWKKTEPVAEEDISLDEVSIKIENLKKKKELIGGIDPEVVAEYEQVKERHDFLSQQVDDLQVSVKKLEQIIDELDEIIVNQFTSNFKQINKLFSQYFRMLFGGGKAELLLLKADEVETEDEENEELDGEGGEAVVDGIRAIKDNFRKKQGGIVGIEIKAVPPGKKMKGIGMLSGGERALTSIALICAIIANNPSPFIVLDEVDAALDEANSIRFAEIISDLSRQTQFIIITHNRATMEKADILYGVTMGRDGVSHLLSVKFDEAKQYANRY